ncbi:MAG: hypothetical protein WC054_00255 [Candidatus Nanopelagicales bacterium]
MKRSELLKLQNFIRDARPSGGNWDDSAYYRDEGRTDVLDDLEFIVGEFEVTEEDVTLCINGSLYVHELGHCPSYPRKDYNTPLRYCEPCMKHRGMTNV